MRERGLFKFIDRFVGVPLAFILGTLARVLQVNRRAPRADPRAILIIKLTAVGDSILAVPAWRSLRDTYPRASMIILCSSVTHDLVRTLPFFDGVVNLNLEKMVKSPRQLLHILRGIRVRQYDLVIDFDQWMRFTALLVLATGAPRRVGFDTRNQYRRFCYTQTVRPPKQRHEVDNFLDLAEAAGARRGERRLQLWLPEEDLSWARSTIARLRQGRGLVFAMAGRAVHRIGQEDIGSL